MADFHIWDGDKRITDVADLTDDMLLAVALDPDGTPSLKAAALSLIKTKLAVPVKATGAEVDTGTDDVKFVTPKAIADSSIGGASIVEKTVAEMQALVGGFVPGQLYLITDANQADLGILVAASTPTALEYAGSCGLLNIDIHGVGDYSGIPGFGQNRGIWTAGVDGAVIDNDVVIWNYRHYLVLSAAAVNGSNPAANPTAYSLLTKDITHGYLEEWGAVLYDLAHNTFGSFVSYPPNENDIGAGYFIVDGPGSPRDRGIACLRGGFKIYANVGVDFSGSFAPYLNLSLNGQAELEADTGSYASVSSTGVNLKADGATKIASLLTGTGDSFQLDGVAHSAALVAGVFNWNGKTVLTADTLPAGASKVASANVRNNHDDEVTHTGDTDFVKVKTITLTFGLLGTARFLYDLKTSNVANTASALIKRNAPTLGDGDFVSSQQDDTSGAYATKSEDVTLDWSPGDTVDLYISIDSGAEIVSVRNFRIAYDDVPVVAVPSVNS